jgi:hypothetical protein
MVQTSKSKVIMHAITLRKKLLCFDEALRMISIPPIESNLTMQLTHLLISKGHYVTDCLRQVAIMVFLCERWGFHRD